MKKLILVVLEAPLYSPVYMVRILGHLRAISDAAPLLFQVYVLPQEAALAAAALPQASLLWCSRANSPHSVDLFALARQHGVPILYDVDDFVWRLPAYSNSTENADRIDLLLNQAHKVTTPSPRLKAWLEARFPSVAPEVVQNPGDLLLPQDAVAHVPMVMANSDFFRLPGDVRDFFESVERAARAERKLVVLYYFSSDLPRYETDRRYLQVIWMGFRSYANYRRLLHIIRPWYGLVALPNDHFSPYKSVVKFAEFACSGAIGLYSDTEPYHSFVRHHEDGFLMQNTPAGWEEALRWALRLPDADREAAAGRARTRMAAEFLEQDIAARWCELLQRVVSARVPAAEVTERVPDLQDLHAPEGAYFYAAALLSGEAAQRQDPLSVRALMERLVELETENHALRRQLDKSIGQRLGGLLSRYRPWRRIS